MGELLTLSEAVAAHARLQPHKTAVRDSRRSLSYAQWDERATRLAQGLIALRHSGLASNSLLADFGEGMIGVFECLVGDGETRLCLG